MRYPLIIVLVVAFMASLAAESSERPTTRALFNPRVSTRTIALNQTVNVSFTTLRPQVEEVDPTRVVQGVLDQPGVTEYWRVRGEPKIELDEKINTLRVSMTLIPRTTGTLDLPEIPVRWLTGSQVARFGQIEVSNHLAHGARAIPLPSDHQRVHGYEWGMSYDDLLKATGKEKGQMNERGQLIVKPQPGLTLIVRGGRLAAAEIRAPGLPFATARNAFHERWGDSLSGSRPDSSLWIIGWIRIEAMADGEGTSLHLVHEGIESRVGRGAVEDQVFSLLDGAKAKSSTPAAQPQETPPTVEAPTRGDETPTERAPAFDPQEEFERQLRRTPDPAPEERRRR